MYTEENLPTAAKESRNKNSDAAFGTIFGISNSFQEQAETFKKGIHLVTHSL
jgi:hypothetical protein